MNDFEPLLRDYLIFNLSFVGRDHLMHVMGQLVETFAKWIKVH